MSIKATRNKSICSQYQEGKTQAELAKIYGISSVRVGQILARNGLTKESRPKPEIFPRSAFVGLFLKPDVKLALRQEAKTCGKTVSTFVSELIEKELKDRHVKIWISKEIELLLPYDQ